MESTLLEFRGLSRRFGPLRVLTGVSASVRGGEALLVTGPNGSGKSTLLRCLAGLLAADGGEILLREEGRNLPLAERRRGVGYLAPDLAFYEELTTAENLDFFARLRRVAPARGRALLDRVGLPHDRAVAALSSGMRQRLRWAWALLHEPRLMLLDEPLQNLDPAGAALAGQLVGEHLAAGGLAVVASPAPLELPGVTAHLVLAG